MSLVPVTPRDSPYQGLIPYNEGDAPFFFGREKETRLIIANLFASPLTLVYGASGVGKSSVLRAGVVHQLRQRDDLVVVAFNSWQSNSTAGLVDAIADDASRAGAIRYKIPTIMRSTWPACALSLCEYLSAWYDGRRFMILLDQFEEYFLYPQEEDFENEFAEAVLQTEVPVSFLISVREDSLAKLDRFEGRIPSLFDNYLRIDHLNRDAGREAITKPVDQYNHDFLKGKPPFSVEPLLVEEVLNQVGTGQVTLGDAGRGMLKTETTQAQIETPFLQMVMMRLWNEEVNAGSQLLRLETLTRLADEETGETGAERIVRTHLDEKMNALTPARQDIAAAIFHYLVTPSGTKIAHTVDDLAEYAKLPPDQLVPMLERLAEGDTRILRGVSGAPNRPKKIRYEIYHDALAAPILDWRSRHVRVREQAEEARRADELRQEAEKHAREEEKAKSAKWLRAAAVILGVMFVIAVALLVVALNRQSLAMAETQRARDAQAAAGAEAKKARDAESAAATEARRAQQAEVAAATEATAAKQASSAARASAASAMKNLQTAIDSLQVDLDAADHNYHDAHAELVKCDLKGTLENVSKEYATLLHRYEALGANVKKSYVIARIRAINAERNKLTCP